MAVVSFCACVCLATVNKKPGRKLLVPKPITPIHTHKVMGNSSPKVAQYFQMRVRCVRRNSMGFFFFFLSFLSEVAYPTAISEMPTAFRNENEKGNQTKFTLIVLVVVVVVAKCCWRLWSRDSGRPMIDRRVYIYIRSIYIYTGLVTWTQQRHATKGESPFFLYERGNNNNNIITIILSAGQYDISSVDKFSSRFSFHAWLSPMEPTSLSVLLLEKYILYRRVQQPHRPDVKLSLPRRIKDRWSFQEQNRCYWAKDSFFFLEYVLDFAIYVCRVKTTRRRRREILEKSAVTRHNIKLAYIIKRMQCPS